MKEEILIETLISLIEPIVTSQGYELYYLEYIEEEEEYYLRIYIDSPNGISLQDCERVSRPISDMLDAKDPIIDSYYLEVSSPGINRYLYNDKHLTQYIGYKVLVEFSTPLDGKKELCGKLLNFNEEEIKLNVEAEDIDIPRKSIASVSLNEDL